MKNWMIAILLTYIFYADLCVIRIPFIIPALLVVFWALVECLEDVAIEYQAKLRRGAKLQKTVRRLILSKRI